MLQKTYPFFQMKSELSPKLKKCDYGEFIIKQNIAVRKIKVLYHNPILYTHNNVHPESGIPQNAPITCCIIFDTH